MADTTPIGISFPIQRESVGGMFGVTFDSVSAAKLNIRNLMLTRPGERPGRPDYGSSFWTAVVFEQNDEFIEDIIITSLSNDIRKFLPELTIDSIEVERTSSDIDIYRVMISVTFRISINSEESTAETMQVNVEL